VIGVEEYGEGVWAQRGWWKGQGSEEVDGTEERIWQKGGDELGPPETEDVLKLCCTTACAWKSSGVVRGTF